MNPFEYAQALQNMTDTRFSNEDMAAFQNGTKGVDYQNLMLQTGISQDYKLSISGGSKKTKYMVSGLFLDRDWYHCSVTLKTFWFPYKPRF